MASRRVLTTNDKNSASHRGFEVRCQPSHKSGIIQTRLEVKAEEYELFSSGVGVRHECAPDILISHKRYSLIEQMGRKTGDTELTECIDAFMANELGRSNDFAKSKSGLGWGFFADVHGVGFLRPNGQIQPA